VFEDSECHIFDGKLKVYVNFDKNIDQDYNIDIALSEVLNSIESAMIHWKSELMVSGILDLQFLFGFLHDYKNVNDVDDDVSSLISVPISDDFSGFSAVGWALIGASTFVFLLGMLIRKKFRDIRKVRLPLGKIDLNPGLI
jgi:hypothetical protein